MFTEKPAVSTASASTRAARNILVANLDEVKAKNLYQFNGLAPYGCRFVVLTTNELGNSQAVAQGAENLEVVSADSANVRQSMLRSLLRQLRSRRFDIAELYPSSRLSFLLALLIKMHRVPLVIVARGEEHYYLTGKMSSAQARFFELTYRLADHVIYKETYMADMLARFGKRSTWMLPNAVSIPERVQSHRQDRCHFLFMNTMKDFRHPEIPLQAFIEICRQRGLKADSDVRLKIAGFLGDKTGHPELLANEARLRAMVEGLDAPVDLHPWSDSPSEWLDDADVFLLPADVVFLNFTLLEAMSRAIPAIVQESDASGRIIDHGSNGYILPREVEPWREHMMRFIDDSSLRERFGLSARERVIDSYSLDSYSRAYSDIYDEIIAARRMRRAGATRHQARLG
jgi:glycosyltransferase involved in cell wall biosynthesis